MSLLTGGSERPIERKVATEAPDRLEALLTGLTNAQVETVSALQRVANSVENSLEERAEKKALVLAAPEIAARQVAEEAALTAEERARIANESAAAARKETVIALEKQRQAEARLLARVEPVFVAPTSLEIELSILKNGEDLIRQFVLKSGGRSIALDVLRGQDGRVRNLVTRKE